MSVRSESILISSGGAAAALGFTVGLFTGFSGPDASVLAAVLPATLSVAGVAAFIFARIKADDAEQIAPYIHAVSCAIFIFSVMLLIGAYSGDGIREYRVTDIRNEQNYREEIQSLANYCDNTERELNALLAEAHSRWLTIQEVCPSLDSEIARKLESARATRKRIYELSECAEATARINADRGERALKAVQIEAICPELF